MSSATDWARSFFSGVFVDFWLQCTPDEQTRQEADFLEKSLRLTAGAQVLDLACGGGRHSLELAARGCRMTGVDISSEFLAVGRAKAAERKLPVTWEERAMHDLPWEGVFDGAFCLGNSLGGLDDTEFTTVLKAVSHALKPGGRFVVNTGVVAESMLPNFKERGWWQMGDILFLVHNSYDPVQARLNMEFTFIRDGQQENRTGFSQVHTYREFCRLLEQAGFRDLEGYGSLAQEPYRLGSHQLFLVANKR